MLVQQYKHFIYYVYISVLSLLINVDLNFFVDSYDARATTLKILRKLKFKNFQLGRTKVFLRAGQIGILDYSRAEVLVNAADCIQRQLHTFIARRDFISIQTGAVSLQACYRASFKLVFKT